MRLNSIPCWRSGCSFPSIAICDSLTCDQENTFCLQHGEIEFAIYEGEEEFFDICGSCFAKLGQEAVARLNKRKD